MSYNHAALFGLVARALPAREAVVFRDRRLTYASLHERASRFANGLLELGVREPLERSALAGWQSGQDHVGLYLHNGNEYLEATLGADLARAVPFNVNYRYVAGELAYLLDDAGASVVVYHAAFAPVLEAVLPKLRRVPGLVQVADESANPLLAGAVDYEDLIESSSGRLPPTDPVPEDLYILYTGGTTGMPKGTLWSQAAIYSAAIGAFAATTGIDTSSWAAAEATLPSAGVMRTLPIPPLMHGAAGWAALGALLSGGTVVIQSEVTRMDAADVLRTIERERVQSVLMVGDAFGRPLCEELERGRYDPGSVSAIVSGGAVLSPGVKERLLELMPHALILDAGGASETGTQMSSLSFKGQTAELGVFEPNEHTLVVDAERRRRVEPGHEEPGWLAKRGPIPLGYLGDEAKTSATFAEVGGARVAIPGDRARLRSDGKIELLGRESATINSGGEKVFAEEVEQALLAHPEVTDVLVVGRPSERWGSEVVAVVELAQGSTATDADLLEAAGARIARYKVPKAIIRVPAVVRSPAGKADYSWARELAVGAGG